MVQGEITWLGAAVKDYLRAPLAGGFRRTLPRAGHALVDGFRLARALLRRRRARLEIKSIQRHRLGLTEKERGEKRAKETNLRDISDSLQTVLKSDDMAGAEGEYDVLCALRGLPDEYYVLNDVGLRWHKWIFFDGQHLRTARLDHVVVGPTGVFVIETKNWSRDSASSEELFSPFQQVRRAGYLCYRVLQEHYQRVSVREIVCARGAILTPPAGWKGHVTGVKGLPGFIRSRTPKLTPAEVEGVANALRAYTEPYAAGGPTRPHAKPLAWRDLR